MPAPIESPRTLIAVRNLAREKIENLRNLVNGRNNKSVVKLKACTLQAKLLTHRREREVIKMIRNC